MGMFEFPQKVHSSLCFTSFSHISFILPLFSQCFLMCRGFANKPEVGTGNQNQFCSVKSTTLKEKYTFDNLNNNRFFLFNAAKTYMNA